MTLFELLKLVKHYWKMITAASLSCAIAAALLSMLVVPARWEASATITASDPSGTVPTSSLVAVVNSLVQDEAAAYSSEDAPIQVTVKIDTALASQPITITAEGSDEGECVHLANSIATKATADASALFANLEKINQEGRADLKSLSDASDVAGVLSGSLLQEVIGTDRTFEYCSFLVNEAIYGKESGFGTAMLTLLGLAGGLLVSLLVVTGIDLVKRPVTGRGDIEEVTTLPVLSSSFSDSDDERLWTNISFVSDEPLQSLCLVPLASDSASSVANNLVAAAVASGTSASLFAVHDGFCTENLEGDGLTVALCPPISSDVAALYCAHKAQATVVVVRAWKDSLRDLVNALQELNGIKAQVLGIALID